MEHFNWMGLIPKIGHDYAHVLTFFLTSLILFFLGFIGRKSLLNKKKEPLFYPSGRFSIQAIFELIVEFIAGLTENVIGEKGRSFIPLFSGLFFFILMNNLIGLLPGMEPSTGNINTTLALGLFSFLFYNVYGFKAHGISYLKQLMGPILYLAPLMVVIELISHLARPLSLSLRLYGSMMGDHIVLGVFLSMVSYILPIIFYIFGGFFCIMQAFVFTLLNMIYISLALSEEH